MALTPCSHCARHLHAHETRCPFCGLGVPTAAPRPVRLASVTRATVFYLGATAAACGSEPSAPPPSSSVSATPMQAVPPASAAPTSVAEAPPPSTAVAPPPSTGRDAPPTTHVRHPRSGEVAIEDLLQAQPSPIDLSGGVPLEHEFPGAQGYGGPPLSGPALYAGTGATVDEPREHGRVDVGLPTVSDADALAPADIARRIQPRRAAFRACYERELSADPAMGGRLVASFDVSPEGRVSSCRIDEATIGSDAVGACVIRVLTNLHVDPAPESDVHVTVPLTFSPAD